MEYSWLIGGVLLFILLPVLTSFYRQKNKEKSLREKLKKEYGQENPRKWRSGEIETISRYSFFREKPGRIDDLTWNDLDMDAVFMQMAFTHSSIGDDLLYDLLRHPGSEEKGLEALEERISFFQKEEEKRVELQLLFHRMGRMERVSLSQYLQYMLTLEQQRNTVHYFALAVIVLSVLLILYSPGIGLPLFFLAVLWNLYTYFRKKREIEPYLVTFRYILGMLGNSVRVKEILPPSWLPEAACLKEAERINRRLSRNAFLLLPMGGLGGGGLEIILDYMRMIFHLDLIKFNSMLRLMQEEADVLWDTYEVLGRLDGCIAIGAYREWLPVRCRPVFTDKKELSMTGIFHPLVEQAVANSLSMKKSIILTGSNASGKSTFLKTVAVNVLLAQTIHTCTAERFILPFAALYTAISLKDSIQKKESYYMAEIAAVKRILDHSRKGERVICMLDEMLKGTNTTERIAAAAAILGQMKRQGVIAVVATHDIQLCALMKDEYENYHFEEEVIGDEIVFSYKLKPSVASSSNAIALLERSGYPADVVREARERMKDFEKKGRWE